MTGQANDEVHCPTCAVLVVRIASSGRGALTRAADLGISRYPWRRSAGASTAAIRALATGSRKESMRYLRALPIDLEVYYQRESVAQPGHVLGSRLPIRSTAAGA